jgi:hypothetical protein
MDHAERGCWDGEEVNRDNIFGMILKECPPGLRWRFSVVDHVFRNGSLADFNPELQQFAVNARSAPQWIIL